jgi:hypothetical protein
MERSARAVAPSERSTAAIPDVWKSRVITTGYGEPSTSRENFSTSLATPKGMTAVNARTGQKRKTPQREVKLDERGVLGACGCLLELAGDRELVAQRDPLKEHERARVRARRSPLAPKLLDVDELGVDAFAVPAGGQLSAVVVPERVIEVRPRAALDQLVRESVVKQLAHSDRPAVRSSVGRHGGKSCREGSVGERVSRLNKEIRGDPTEGFDAEVDIPKSPPPCKSIGPAQRLRRSLGDPLRPECTLRFRPQPGKEDRLPS